MGDSAGLKARFPRTEVRGFHQSGRTGARRLQIDYRKRPGRPPRVPPRLEPRELKKPLGREALARALRSSAGMPRVRPRRLVSTPKRPERPCSAAIWRWKAVLLKAS